MKVVSIIIPEYKVVKFGEELTAADFAYTIQPFPVLPDAHLISVNFNARREADLQAVVQKVTEHFNEGMVRVTADLKIVDKDTLKHEA